MKFCLLNSLAWFSSNCALNEIIHVFCRPSLGSLHFSGPPPSAAVVIGGHSDGLSSDSLSCLEFICAWGSAEEVKFFWQTHNPITTMLVNIPMMTNEVSLFLCQKAMRDGAYSGAEFKSVAIRSLEALSICNGFLVLFAFLAMV